MVLFFFSHYDFVSFMLFSSASLLLLDLIWVLLRAIVWFCHVLYRYRYMLVSGQRFLFVFFPLYFSAFLNCSLFLDPDENKNL